MKFLDQAPNGPGTVHKVKSPPPKKTPEACNHCGLTNHKAADCRLKDATCHKCGRKGHIQRACRSGRQPQKGGKFMPRRREKTKWVNAEPSEDDSDGSANVCTIRKPSTRPIRVELQVNGKLLAMEVDTGAAVSLISYKRLKRVQPRISINKTTVVLRTYTSEVIPVRGEVLVNVQYGNQNKKLTLYVTRNEGPCLMGRDWLRSIRLDWRTIGLTLVDTTQTQVFRDELGTMKSIKAELKLRENATPKFHRPRPVPFALKGVIEEELKRLEEKRIVKVSHSEWAAPIVPVPKKDGKVRVCTCGDYKVTINQNLDVDQYPPPPPSKARRFVRDLSQWEDLLYPRPISSLSTNVARGGVCSVSHCQHTPGVVSIH